MKVLFAQKSRGTLRRSSRVVEGPSGCALVELTQGLWATVDIEDAELVSRYTWSATRHNLTHYASAANRGTDYSRRVYMHRLILQVSGGLQVDHADRNGLNNRRCNLRAATRSQNCSNREKTGVTSRFKGVYWNKKDRRWVAQIGSNSDVKFLGGYLSEENAAMAYDSAAFKAYGAFAVLNFPERLGHSFDEPPVALKRGGENNGRAILNAENVRTIRSLAGIKTQKDIAGMFGVSTSCIQRVISGLSWPGDDRKDRKPSRFIVESGIITEDVACLPT